MAQKGLRTKVVDFFLSAPDPINYICGFITAETKLIGISSTFLSAAQSAEDSPYEINSRPAMTRSKVKYFEPFLWASSDYELSNWLVRLKLAARKINPKIRIVVGGSKTTNIYQLVLEPDFSLPNWYRQIDYFVLGFSDDAISELVRQPDSMIKSRDVRGLKFVFGPQDYPVQGFDGITFQRNSAIQPGEWLPIEISRGCAFSCKFCTFFKRQPNFKAVAVLEAEMRRNYDEFGVTGYHFSDDCFNDNYQKVVALTDMFMKLPFKLEWVSYARADLCHKYPDMIDRMVESGARGLFFGIESLDFETARYAGKTLHPDLVKNVLTDLRRKGGDRLNIDGSFIIGLPKETPETLEITLQWLKTQKILDSLSFSTLGVFKTPPDELANGIMDFADYSKNPTKYGFEKVDGFYWKHATMDSDMAYEISKRWEAELKGRPGIGGLKSHVFSYPRVRSLGFEHAAATTMINEADYSVILKAETDWLSRYFNDLKDDRDGSEKRHLTIN